MDTPRTDRDRAERLASILYPGASIVLWSPADQSLHYVLGYLPFVAHGDTLGSGATPDEAWCEAASLLRARAVALGDALAAELGAP